MNLYQAIVLGLMIYGFVGMLIGIRHIQAYSKSVDDGTKANILQHIIIKWPVHLFVMFGLWYLKIEKEDD